MIGNFEQKKNDFVKKVERMLGKGAVFSWYWLDEDFNVVTPSEAVDKARYAITEHALAYDLCEEKFLVEHKNNDGYLYWYVCGKNVDIHVKMGELWCEKPNTNRRLVVDHIDGCKTNNNKDNLRWATYSENSRAQDVQERKARSLVRTNNCNQLADVIKKQEVMITDLEAENARLKYEVINRNEKIVDLSEQLKDKTDEMECDLREQLEAAQKALEKVVKEKNMYEAKLMDARMKQSNDYVKYLVDTERNYSVAQQIRDQYAMLGIRID